MLVFSRVSKTAVLTKGYLASAAHQSMTIYLDDWILARDHLERRIEKLTAARDQRKIDTESGAWPPTKREI